VVVVVYGWLSKKESEAVVKSAIADAQETIGLLGQCYKKAVQ
jgi:hypothetical protein